MKKPGLDSLPASKIDDHFLPLGRALQEHSDDGVDSSHPEPVSSIDGRGSPLRFADKVVEEVRFGIVKSFDASLGHDAAVVGAHDQFGIFLTSHSWTRLLWIRILLQHRACRSDLSPTELL